MWLEDARIYQIASLSMFLLVGIVARDWTLHAEAIGVTIATCLITQWIAVNARRAWSWEFGFWRNFFDRPIELKGKEQHTAVLENPNSKTQTLKSLLSAVITSLGLCLLLRADHYSTLVLAGGLAISSKFLLQVRGKHIFNPANFGIVAALSLTEDAWVSPGQWGESGWCVLIFLCAGGLVLQRVGRWDTSVAFLGSYAVLEALRNAWLGWTWDVWAHRLMSGSLLLFACFMITDPRTIPDTRSGRVIWAGSIALLTFVLRNVFFVATAPFWALFALAPLSILLDRLLPADRFSWTVADAGQEMAQLDVPESSPVAS